MRKLPIKLPIDEIYSHEASKLLEAKKSVGIIHKTGDIDASGDELEIHFRQMLAKRLPSKYYVGHGHIVDSNLNVSPQFDVIIADSHATQILYDAENGTQYFPYESVYAVGEIKSSYYKNRKYVQKYTSAVKDVREQFYREPVSGNYIGNGIDLGPALSVNGTREIQNQLFSFMLFGSKNDCEPSELNEQLTASNSTPNPNIICFLDGTIITRSNLIENAGNYSLGALELDPLRQNRNELGLVEISFSNKDKSGQALATLMLGIINHLNSTRLKNPPFDKYIASILETAAHTGNIIRMPNS
jgi:hypothetical protein